MEQFAILKMDNETHYPTHVVSNNDYLDMVMSVFTEGRSFAKDVKKELANPDSPGRTGNNLDLDFDNSKVTICYCFSDYCIVIDRQQLIKIMDKVIALIETEAEYIVLTQEDENSPIEVSNQLPRGLELYTQDRCLKYRFNNQENNSKVSQ